MQGEKIEAMAAADGSMVGVLRAWSARLLRRALVLTGALLAGSVPVLAQAVESGAVSAVAAAAPAERFALVDEGTIKDSQTGLLWTQRENGFAVDWYAARDYCARKEGGWRLPRSEDFAAIQAELSRVTRPCADATCKSETPFRLANGWLWSDTSNGISEAIGVNLVTGEQQPTYRARRHRALCVSGVAGS